MSTTTSTYKERDQYGRSVTHFTVNGRTVAVVVLLPKHCADRYLVNDWTAEQDAPGKVSYASKRNEAVSRAQAVVAREVTAQAKEA